MEVIRNCQHFAKPLTAKKLKYCSKHCADMEWSFENRLPRCRDIDAQIDHLNLLSKPWRPPPGRMDASP